MSLVLIDVDRLKIANDRYGHQAGDELVRGLVLGKAAHGGDGAGEAGVYTDDKSHEAPPGSWV